MTADLDQMRVAAAEERPIRRRRGSRTGWTIVVLTSIGIVAFAVSPYLTQTLRDLADAGTGLAGNYVDRPPVVLAAFYTHVVAGGLALVLGPFQFWRGLRDRRPAVHRWIGRTYLASVGVGGVAGIVIAPSSEAGLVGMFGFGALGVLWLLSGWRAYAAIRHRDVANHQAWMIRNFALTYSAVMLRVWLPLLLVVQSPFGPFDYDAAFANAYAAVPFLCWVPNVVVAEWLIRRRGLPSYRIGPPPAIASGAPSGTPAVTPAVTPRAAR
ncbi:DUF2306 domain-containing protein [Agromyces sp. LHK192]|uniref:DUF2306 domain-containing protein n=1 Tax=Agromyces sp. LHK192 TaxID=2498704 RepID=UPI000FD7146A|nr:DUF2306 domain-containing protein [Agromyces sp. LHK192]